MNTVVQDPEGVLKFKLINLKAKIPRKGSCYSAGYDLFLPSRVTIKPRTFQTIPVGLKVALPPGTYGRIAPRSGLACRYGMAIGAGVIDRDYRGEIKVLVFNHGEEDIVLGTETAFAQLIIEEIRDVTLQAWQELPQTRRGSKGFGSSDLPIQSK